MTPGELRQKYLKFFEKRGHTIIPSASLVPENDPTTLFTSSGMQPLVPYLLGQPHPAGKRLVNSQRSIRVQDIEEVGDNRHTTFFEMLGNWSLGDYFKHEQLGWFFEFLTKELGLDPKRLYVTVFRGNNDVPRDEESVGIWKKLFDSAGIKATDVDFADRDGMQNGRIFYYDEKKNWWSRSGVPSAMPPGEPGGPDSEVFYDFGTELKLHENSQWKDEPCHVNCDCGRFLEIGNSVFMQYQKQADGSFKELPQKNVDFGGGFERILAALNDDIDVFATGLFQPVIQSIEAVTGVTYEGEHKREFRVIADHTRAAVMLLADGVLPSNKEQGHVLRRIIRRAVRYGKLLGVQTRFLAKIAEAIIPMYIGVHPTVSVEQAAVKSALTEEENRFATALDKGMREIEKLPKLDGNLAFTLYETYGFPFELTEEIARERGQHVEYGSFRKAFEKHQEQSRTASKGMFKGGLADKSEEVTRFHTATHLLHAALRNILGEHVSQQGSNITAERLRFDYTHNAPLSNEQKQKVQELMNEKIKEGLPVTQETIHKEKALAAGALAFFRDKYGDNVSVFTIGKDPNKDWFSKELCGGPHVKNTKEIGPVEIFKDESIGAGKRRIYVRFSM